MRRAVLGSILALACSGCPGEGGGSASKTPALGVQSPAATPAEEEPLGPGPHEGGSSPRQCYRLMERAFKSKDFAGYYDQLSASSKEQLLPMMTLVAGGIAAADEASMTEFTGLLRRYGLEDLGKEPEPGTKQAENPMELFKDVEVARRRALFGEVMTFALSRQKNEEEEETLGLENLKVEGDAAVGEIVKKVPSTGAVHREPVYFIREGGRWFADVRNQ